MSLKDEHQTYLYPSFPRVFRSNRWCRCSPKICCVSSATWHCYVTLLLMKSEDQLGFENSPYFEFLPFPLLLKRRSKYKLQALTMVSNCVSWCRSAPKGCFFSRVRCTETKTSTLLMRNNCEKSRYKVSSKKHATRQALVFSLCLGKTKVITLVNSSPTIDLLFIWWYSYEQTQSFWVAFCTFGWECTCICLNIAN